MAKFHIKFKKKNTTTSLKWIFTITIWSFFIAIGLNFISNILMEKLDMGASFFILLCIILFGIICDIIGVAVASATEIQLHSMAASRVKGSNEAIFLIRNASAVSNFFNDVIGDICGIISGAAAAAIVIKILENFRTLDEQLLEVIFASIVAALTICGKAVGKGIAMKNSNHIVYRLGYVMSFFSKQNK